MLRNLCSGGASRRRTKGFFNHSWLDFTGRTLDEEWGVGWAEGLHPEDFSRAMDVYQDAFAARRAFEMEYRLRRIDGQGLYKQWSHGTFDVARAGLKAGTIGPAK